MRQLGYVETGVHTGMSAREVCHPVPTAVADVPDMTEYELAVPGDIVNLWTKYRSLPPERQRQFLAAASKLQEALSHWGERDTASFTSMVVACEALKPDDPAYSDHNLYDVVEALLGREASERLRTQLFDPKIHPKVHPQSIRSAHLHRGIFQGLEFAHGVGMSNFRDPSFDEASSELFRITKAAMIDWLSRDGTFVMRKRIRRTSWRRWVREHALAIMPLAMAAGLCLGWLLKMVWSG